MDNYYRPILKLLKGKIILGLKIHYLGGIYLKKKKNLIKLSSCENGHLDDKNFAPGLLLLTKIIRKHFHKLK